MSQKCQEETSLPHNDSLEELISGGRASYPIIGPLSLSDPD
jgi:hypothetical protein